MRLQASSSLQRSRQRLQSAPGAQSAPAQHRTLKRKPTGSRRSDSRFQPRGPGAALKRRRHRRRLQQCQNRSSSRQPDLASGPLEHPHLMQRSASQSRCSSRHQREASAPPRQLSLRRVPQSLKRRLRRLPREAGTPAAPGQAQRWQKRSCLRVPKQASGPQPSRPSQTQSLLHRLRRNQGLQLQADLAVQNLPQILQSMIGSSGLLPPGER